MVGYKLSKNDWATPFFVIFRSVKEKLLVTVSFDHPVGGGIDGQGANTYLNMDQIQDTRYQPTELKKNWQMLMMITLRTVLLLAKLLYTVLALTRPKPLSWASGPTILWRAVSICSNSSTDRVKPSMALESKSCPALDNVLLMTGDHQTAMEVDGSKRRKRNILERPRGKTLTH